MSDAAPALTLTKLEAASRQIDAAILAYLVGDFDICITLAGAAEGMFSDRTEGDFFTLSIRRVAQKGVDKTLWIAALNLERDWLKHPTTDLQEPMTFGAEEAAMMLVRAMSKLDVWSAAMNDIKPILLDLFQT